MFCLFIAAAASSPAGDSAPSNPVPCETKRVGDEVPMPALAEQAEAEDAEAAAPTAARAVCEIEGRQVTIDFESPSKATVDDFGQVVAATGAGLSAKGMAASTMRAQYDVSFGAQPQIKRFEIKGRRTTEGPCVLFK